MINQRITDLRAVLKEKNLDAIIIPSTDPHQSEYVAEHWKVRPYFSGFTGSAGTLIVTQDVAAMWTDSRYFLQCEKQCANSVVELYKQSIPHAPEHVAWLCGKLSSNSKIAIDYRQFSKDQVDYILSFAGEKRIRLVNTPDLVDEIWINRPPLPNFPIEIFPLQYAGESIESKLSKIVDEIVEQQADFYFLSNLDEIAWVFNIRSRDIECTPLVTSYALIGLEKSILFCNKDRFSDDLQAKLAESIVQILDYSEIAKLMPSITDGKRIVTDASSLNYASYKASKGDFVYQSSLVKHLKAIKNEAEIRGAKNCMKKDGVAMTKFFIWLERNLEKKTLSEYEIGRKLEYFRAQQEDYVMESFSAIVGYKGNGAIIHYRAPEEGSALVSNNGILLIDSGAQYKDGTTDVTRTVWLGGTPSQELKTAFTAVLQGYIELHEIRFPSGTMGIQLDAFARIHLWKKGLNFPHGTGHGIGSYSMVHEPAQGFVDNLVSERASSPHLAGQFTTIEPGCYVKDKFGIRTENVVVSKLVETTSFGEFLGYEALTLFPIDKKLIDFSLMSLDEITWLNNYHQKVWGILNPELNDEEKEWMKKMCEAIDIQAT